MVTREEFRKLFYDKVVSADESPVATFASAITRILREHGIDPDSVDTNEHTFMFALSLYILMRELGDAIFGKEEENR